MQRYFAQALELKRASVALARVSEAGVFEGYASVFGVVDTANDAVMHGAFADTLRRRGPLGVKMLWQHQPFEPIGTWQSIAEDARGLKVVGRLDLAVARAREALALMRSGAVDGLSIGFRAERAATDQKSGVRRLQRIDLWEISIVTFPALPQARIGAFEHVSPKFRPPPERPPATLADLRLKLTRLRMRTAALNFEVKLRRFSHSLEMRYSANQPRVPAGSREGGQWTSGGGGSGDGLVQVALNTVANVVNDAGDLITQVADLIDLRDEEGGPFGGHAIREHVGKSEEYLKRRLENSRIRFGSYEFWLDSVGSFPSLTAANKLVNATIAQYQSTVEKLANGEFGSFKKIDIDAWFGSTPTGYEAYASSFRSQPDMRETFGVRVVLRHNPASVRGYSVVSAFPIR